jgi:hypothetical protein
MSNFNRITLSSTKDPQNTGVYPTIFASDLIISNLPKKIKVERRVLVPSPIEVPESIAIESKPFMLSNWSAASNILFIVSILALAARFFNLYHHDGVTIAAAIIALVSWVWSIRSIGKEKAAYLRKLAATSLSVPPKLSSPVYKTIITEETQVPNWQSTLSGKVKSPDCISEAKKGLSEPDFETYLDDYFSSILIKKSYGFKIPNFKYPYTPDFWIQLPCGLSIDVEIDEPYIMETKEPHHCTNRYEDDSRDRFFTEGNWIVIRFSEKQVVTQPEECCYYIASLVSALTGDVTFTKKFRRSMTAPEPDLRWTIADAKKMAANDYRNTYLPIPAPKRKKSIPISSNHAKPTPTNQVKPKPVRRKNNGAR